MQTIVVCAIIVKENTVFAALRKKPMSNAGFWELPGGKVKIGESDEQALIREMHEEFNASIKVGDRFMNNLYKYDHMHIQLKAYWCKLKSETITPTEHERVKWLDPNDLLTLNWTPADILIIQKLQNHLLAL